MKRSASIVQILRPLSDVPNQAYLSNAMQVADMLEGILSEVGVAEIWQTCSNTASIYIDILYIGCEKFPANSIEPYSMGGIIGSRNKIHKFLTFGIVEAYSALPSLNSCFASSFTMNKLFLSE